MSASKNAASACYEPTIPAIPKPGVPGMAAASTCASATRTVNWRVSPHMFARRSTRTIFTTTLTVWSVIPRPGAISASWLLPAPVRVSMRPTAPICSIGRSRGRSWTPDPRRPESAIIARCWPIRLLIDPQSPSRNFETIGDTAYLYFTRFHFRNCAANLDRDLLRVPITVRPSS
jgi:hypothetical protein